MIKPYISNKELIKIFNHFNNNLCYFYTKNYLLIILNNN